MSNILIKQGKEIGGAGGGGGVPEFVGTVAEFEQAVENNEIAEGTTVWLLDDGVEAPVYGVTWDGSSTQAWTRTDASANFSDPAPAVNNGVGSSPFDDIYPWKDMTKVNDAECGVLVKIPKFYYKLTKVGSVMSIQITEKPRAGFSVCPACADRGDGKGERDYILVGRYKCGASNYKSSTGVKPETSHTRAEFRTAIHNLGTNVWQYDISTHITIWMLYLVEFANWDVQKTLGFGCGNGVGTETMGLTDSMQYHTGTAVINKYAYGCGIQYRNIEGLWENAYEYCDGIYFSGTNIYAIKNPSNFSDTSGGTLVGTRANVSGFMSSMGVSSIAGYEWFMYPDAVSGDADTYIGDYYYYNASGTILIINSAPLNNRQAGLFFLYGSDGASYTSTVTGSRLIKLP